MEIYSDGFLLGKNPAKKGGWTIMSEDYKPIIEFLEKDNLTGNEVELKGVLKACEIAKEQDIIVTDSMNSIYWINRAGKGKKLSARPDLTEFAKQAALLIKEKKLNLLWRPREENLAGQYNQDYGQTFKRTN